MWYIYVVKLTFLNIFQPINFDYGGISNSILNRSRDNLKNKRNKIEKFLKS